jgi:hypothetical protein
VWPTRRGRSEDTEFSSDCTVKRTGYSYFYFDTCPVVESMTSMPTFTPGIPEAIRDEMEKRRMTFPIVLGRYNGLEALISNYTTSSIDNILLPNKEEEKLLKQIVDTFEKRMVALFIQKTKMRVYSELVQRV